MEWQLLAAAIGSELAATLSLRAAAHGGRRGYAVTVAGYLAAFGLLSLALGEGLGLGVAYAVWTAVGVALVAVASRFIFDEPLTPVMGAGIGLIVVGVVFIHLGTVR